MGKILIADSLSPKVVQMLKDAGNEVLMDPSITEQTLPQKIGDYNVLIVRSKKVTRAAIEAAKGLNLIVRAGAGVNTIDVDAASEHGVYVCNTPGMNNDAVAELAMGHIIACDRHIADNTAHLRKGEWRKKLYLECNGLRDRTLGIVGRGNIAHSLINIAKGMHMNIMVWSRRFSAAEAKALGVEYAPTLLDLAKNSDAISVHLAYSKTETHHIINGEFFAAMKPGAIFVNTSRGEIVDTAAMIAAIKDKKILVGLDVYENEPAASMGDFANTELANLVASATAHIGASTEQAADRIAEETFRVVEAFNKTGQALNCVNINAAPHADEVIICRHTGVLSDIIACAAKNGAAILSTSNVVLTGAKNMQQVSLLVKCPQCFKDELATVPGVVGVTCTRC